MRARYEIAFNFESADALLGNLAVRIQGDWFAIGECIRNSEPIYDSNGELQNPTIEESEVESADISTIIVWLHSMFWQMQNE